jgi:hypothetical protein
MMHDPGLARPVDRVDFTLASARVARDVAETVGLSTAATETMRTAITLHHSPGVTLADGPVAYLLSAGAGVDVAGLRSWKLPLSRAAGFSCCANTAPSTSPSGSAHSAPERPYPPHQTAQPAGRGERRSRPFDRGERAATR